MCISALFPWRVQFFDRVGWEYGRQRYIRPLKPPRADLRIAPTRWHVTRRILIFYAAKSKKRKKKIKQWACNPSTYARMPAFVRVRGAFRGNVCALEVTTLRQFLPITCTRVTSARRPGRVCRRAY